MRNLPLALSRVWELYPSTGRKVTVGACCFRQVDLGTPGAVTQGVRDTQYQQATPLDSQTDFPSVPSCGSLSGRFPETLMKKYSEKVSENLVRSRHCCERREKSCGSFLVECLWEHGVAFR